MSILTKDNAIQIIEYFFEKANLGNPVIPDDIDRIINEINHNPENIILPISGELIYFIVRLIVQTLQNTSLIGDITVEQRYNIQDTYRYINNSTYQSILKEAITSTLFKVDLTDTLPINI